MINFKIIKLMIIVIFIKLATIIITKLVITYNKIKVYWETQINKVKIMSKINKLMFNRIVQEFNIKKKIKINN